MKWSIIFLLFIGCAGYKPTPLTTNQVLGEVAWQAIHIVDWGQTLSIADNPDEYKEYNPLIGKHPSRGRVNIVMLAGAVVHPLVTYAIPSEYRAYWLGGTIAASGLCVISNNSIGLKMNF